MKLESHIISIIEGEKEAPISKALMRLVSGGYRTGSLFHRMAYDFLLPKTRLSLPVISVGNIVAGGSGKTPFIHYLAKELAPKKVAILSRGYKRKSNKTLVVTEDMLAEECGDEPKLLKHKLPEVSILVGKDRAYLGLQASALGAEILLIDDGLQHRKLHRDVEIITMEANNLFGGGHFLPYGYLRDSPKSLSYAHLIVLSGVKDKKHFNDIEKKLRKWTDAPIISMKAIYENREEIAGKKVGGFCAIARPQRFFKTLESLGCEVVSSSCKPDHDPFSTKELAILAQQAKEKGAERLVCTEKDAIKWSQALELALPITPLQMVLEPQFGGQHLETLIHGVRS